MSPTRTTLLLLALLVPFLGACRSKGPTREQKRELYAENALRYYYLGEFERAQEQAEKGLAIDPDDYDLRLVLARVLQHRGTVQTVARAKALFRDLSKENREDDRVLIGLGEALEREGVAYDIAAREIESGDRLTEAADPAARVEELRSKARERWQEAHDAFMGAYDLRRRTPQANGLQRTSSLLGRHEESLEWSQVLLELLDFQIDAWRRDLARVEVTAAEEKRWRTNLEEDLDLKARTLLFMSSTLAKLERHEDAIETLDELIEIDPELAEAYSRRAYHQMKLGMYQRAIDSLDRFITRTLDRPMEDPAVMKAYDMLEEAKAHLAAAAGERD